MACPICERRKGKRTCPAKGAKICSECCGANRERSIACPLDCGYLADGRAREPVGFEGKQIPYEDIRVSEAEMARNEPLLEACARGVLAGAMQTPGAVDSDARAALEALIETHKTLSSGIYYETQPQSMLARPIAGTLKEQIQERRKADHEQSGLTRISDSDVVRTLVFLYRIAVARDNGREKGRAFLHFLTMQFDFTPEPAGWAPGSSIILPGR
jgi:hypothetical protein